MRRRSILAAAASAVVAGAPIALARGFEPEPVLALAKRHRVALAAYLAAAEARERAQAGFEGKYPDGWARDATIHEKFTAEVGALADEQNRLFDAENDLAEQIMQTRATTPAGLAAKLEVALSRSHQWHLDAGADELEPVALALLADLGAMS